MNFSGFLLKILLNLLKYLKFVLRYNIIINNLTERGLTMMMKNTIILSVGQSSIILLGSFVNTFSQKATGTVRPFNAG